MSVQQHHWAVCPSLHFFLFWNERKQKEGNSHHLAGLTPSCTPEISMGQSHSDGRRHPHWLRSAVSTGSQSPKAGFYPSHNISDQQGFKMHDAALHPQQELLVGSEEGASRRKAERGHSSTRTWICHAFLASSETDMGMSDVAICSFAIERICVMRAILGASFARFIPVSGQEAKAERPPWVAAMALCQGWASPLCHSFTLGSVMATANNIFLLIDFF